MNIFHHYILTTSIHVFVDLLYGLVRHQIKLTLFQLNSNLIIKQFLKSYFCGVKSKSVCACLCRIWLRPRPAGSTAPVQQLGYVNIVPDNVSKHGALDDWPVFSDLKTTLDKFNEKLRSHPLPGRLSIFSYLESTN